MSGILQDRQCKYKRNIEARLRNNFCRAKARNIKYYKSLSVVLVTQNAMRMRPIILSSVACLTLPSFSRCPIKGKIFGKGWA